MNNCTMVGRGYAGYLSLGWSYANFTSNATSFQIYNSTVGSTNASQGYNGSVIACDPGESLTITNSTLYQQASGYITPGFIFGNTTRTAYLTNVTVNFVGGASGYIISMPGTYAAQGTTLNVTNYYATGGTITGSASPAFNTFNLVGGLTLTLPGLRMGSAITFGAMNLSNNFCSTGYTLTATTITNYATFVASNSTLLIDQALIRVSGTVSQMTSTIQFGTSTNAAACNLLNFNSVLCNYTGKLVNFTNANLTVTGTLSASGNPQFNFNGASLTVSNPALVQGLVSNVTVKGSVLNATTTQNTSGKVNDLRKRGQD